MSQNKLNRWCVVFKSSKKNDTYLYMLKNSAFNKLPITLQTLFSPQQQVMSFIIEPEKKYARFQGAELLEWLQESGYHVQLPPAHDTPLPTAPEYSARRSKMPKE